MVAARTLFIAMTVCSLSVRLMICRGECVDEGEDEFGVSLWWCGVVVPVTGAGLWIERYFCSGSAGLIVS